MKSKNNPRIKTFTRMVLIGAGSLILGFIANQMLSGGIKWPVLALAFPWTGSDADVEKITCDSTFFMLDDLCVVDVRPEEEYNIDHIPGAVSLPFITLYDSPEMIDSWNRTQTLVLYCFKPTCKETMMMSDKLKRMGFKNILVLQEGFAGWLEREYPVALGEGL